MPGPITFTTAPQRASAFADAWRNASSTFCCVLAHTDTCLIPGLSAAGVNDELRPFTPAADAEVVLSGRAQCLPNLPSNPLGAPGPSGITRAALHLGGIQPLFVGTGLQVWPGVTHRRIAGASGGNIELGRAVPHAGSLLEAGFALGRELAATSQHVVIGESIPGGTSTALALLLALGFAADGRVSGSLPGNAHELKTRVAHKALAAASLEPGDGRADPLRAVSEVGDPMQPVVAGAALGAVGAGVSVMLAGGSQMLAVAALIAALDGPTALEKVAIGTTRWVVADPAADVVGLAAEISSRLPILAVNLNFASSRHAPLHAYEAFMVKEGVGAGGASIAALLATGETIARLHEVIDDVYGELLGAPFHTLERR
jgi:uncharacterized protein (TIGR00303 family)